MHVDVCAEGVSAPAAGCAVGTKVMETLCSSQPVGLAPLSPGVISAVPGGGDMNRKGSHFCMQLQTKA